MKALSMIGWLIFMTGAASMDSASIVLPVALVLIGLGLMTGGARCAM